MPEIDTFMSVDAGDIDTILGVDSGDIDTVMGVELVTFGGPAYTGQTFVCFGGTTSGADWVNTIDYKSSTSDGNASPFGDITSGACNQGSAVGGGGRAVFAGGAESPDWTTARNDMDYVTISSTGNSQDAGDLSEARSEGPTSGGNGSRGIWAGGYAEGQSNTMDYMTISSTSGTSDFGDLNNQTSLANGSGSLTRFIHSGGSDLLDVIDYVAFDTPGGAQDFGDLVAGTRANGGGLATEARIINSHGGNIVGGTGVTDRMDYINPASTGDAARFGDLSGTTSMTIRYQSGGFSDNTRGEMWGGSDTLDQIIYVTIASTGDATDAGNMTIGARARSQSGASG